MGAKDTVMKPGNLCRKVCHDHFILTLKGKDCTGLDCRGCQLEVQAEISFKAGYKYALEGAVIEGGYESVKKAGIKEVVDSIHQHFGYSPRLTSEITQKDRNWWQAKLKEWRLKDEE